MLKAKLNNGVEMPMLGFGVYQVENAKECERAVSDAISAGYRLIDTASVYMNEEPVGKAVRKSGIPRDDIFIATKVWIGAAGYERTKKAFADSLKRLGLDYIDLYLVHMPLGDYYGSWRAMEELCAEGKIRAAGVCNFLPELLGDLCGNAGMVPAVNQVEMHPFFQQRDSISAMRKLGVQPQAWGPFAEGMNGIFSNPALAGIGEKYGKSPAQVVLRWHVQRGVAAIPKSVRKSRIEENFDIWDFSLDESDMEAIKNMDSGKSLILNLFSSDTVKRLYGIKNPDTCA